MMRGESMKKFFGNFLLLISVLLVSLVAVPWNDLSQWGLGITVLTDNEIMIKGGIGAFALIVSLIFLLVSNKEYKNYGHVKNVSRNSAVLPLYGFALANTAYTAYLSYYVYTRGATTTKLLTVAIFGLAIINLLVCGTMLISTFKKTKNGGRVFRFIFLFELAAVAGAVAYWYKTYRVTNYTTMSARYMILAVPLFIVLYVVFLIVTKVKDKRSEEEELLETEIDEIKQEKRTGSKKGSVSQHQVSQSDNRKTMIVSKEQTIVSSQDSIDPTNIVYEDVEVDPEFSKTSNQSNQANSIEYYIEKPKMFKPLDPSFDELVAYIRELPQVVTKLDDDRITFYVDRKPFLVLMNFGNYYRLAFKYDLEQGIRLIIKYPTISKNKSTRDELWFKANNYGDIPKDVIYSIVKTAYNNFNA